MDRFLPKLLPKLIQEDTNILNNPITSNAIDSVINTLPTNEIPGSDGFTVEVYTIFKDIYQYSSSSKKLKGMEWSQTHLWLTL